MRRGALLARIAEGPADLRASQLLRRSHFPKDRGGEDRFDAAFRHVLLEDAAAGSVLGSFRFLVLPRASAIDRTCSAQYYDLGPLKRYPGAVMEIGRFCLDSARADPDLLRLAWAFITRLVDAERVALLFGCASFPGTDPARHAGSFAYLGARHLAPPHWRPGVKSACHTPFGAVAPVEASAARLPPLLRTYLGMGGWVSDHAVIDHDMGTTHVFTGVEIAAIPPARARLLRAIAGDVPVA